MKLARINLNLPADLYRRLKVAAQSQDRTVTTVLTRALQNYLDTECPEPKTAQPKGRKTGSAV